MKLKTLKKKIRRLETRLLEGPKKLAKLKGKLAALVKANATKAKKKSTARAAGAREKEPNSNAKSQVKAADAKGAAPKKVKRKLNLSPERREQLAAAMRARWAAKRAAEATPPDGSASHDFTIGEVPQSR
jgi:rRNA maturation endonuclease Nob1